MAQGRWVHFIGDSTMRQNFWALAKLMRAAGVIRGEMWKQMKWTTIDNATFSVDGFEFLTGHRRVFKLQCGCCYESGNDVPSMCHLVPLIYRQ